MIPSHIRNELLHRLRSADDISEELLSALDIDGAACPIEPEECPELFAMKLNELEGESDPIRGYVPFELTLGAMGETTRLDCRVSYIVTLYDDESRFTDEPMRIVGSMAMHYEMLDWRDPDACDEKTGEPHRLPVPRWVKADLYSLIPRCMERKLDDLIEEQAVAYERQAGRPADNHA